MQRKRVILISILALFTATVLWLALRPGPALVVEGTLSAQDIAAIKGVVRRELRHQIFASLSRSTITKLPANIRNLILGRVIHIEVSQENFAYVTLKRNYDRVFAEYISYQVEKRPEGWQLATFNSTSYPISGSWLISPK
jgi:hypothetical protein